MATMPCPRCRADLEVGAPFCIACGARMADFAIDGVPPGMMPLCGGCGALTASDRGSCMLCGASYALKKLVPDRSDGRYFTRIVANFLCRSCGRRSPLNALDVDGTVTCARCGLTQAYDVSVWGEALETAHGVSDIAFPKPEGRFAEQGDPSVVDHPAAAVGKSRSALAFDASSVTMAGAVMRTRSISIEAAPGHPICETCRAPLVAHVEGASLRIGCEPCNTVMRYALPTPSEPIANWPAGVFADDCCVDRPDAQMVQSAGGAVAIKCPTCNAALEARPDQHFVSCGYCRTACRIPSRTLWALHTETVEAKPFWLMFEGPSRMRASYLASMRADADQRRRARERAERERVDAAQRAEHTQQFDMPATPAYGRRDHLLRAAVGVLLTFLLGALIWGAEIASIISTGRTESGGMLGRLFGFGETTAPVSSPSSHGSSSSSTFTPPIAPMTYTPVVGCRCPASATGLAEDVQLGLRIGTTMQIGAMVTTTVDWALVGQKGPLVNLASSPSGAPSTVIESHALDLVLACGDHVVHVIDGTHVTTYALPGGEVVSSFLAQASVGQTTTATTGLTVTCSPGTFEGAEIVFRDRDGTPRRASPSGP